MSKSTLVRNINSLVLAQSKIAKGAKMKDLPIIENAWLLTDNERIVDFGTMKNCPERADEIIEASGRFV